MNTITLKEYISALNSAIYKNCSSDLCEICGEFISAKRILRNISNFHPVCERTKDIVTQKGPSCVTVQAWFTMYVGLNTTIAYPFFYKNVPVECIDKYLILVKSLLSGIYESQKDPRKYLKILIDILLGNPNLTVDEIIKSFPKSTIDNSLLKRIIRYIAELNDSKISELYKIWELSEEEYLSGDYNNIIQWLPEEMIADIAAFEGKLANRFSYSQLRA